MKRMISVLLIIVLCLSVSGCLQREQTYFGFDKEEFTIVKETDTHGGFLGDGEYYFVLDCSANAQKARELVSGWKKLPLSDNITHFMPSDEHEDGSYYYRFPEINNGVYLFYDRHYEAVDPYSDADYQNRHSVNYSIAVYDYDTERLYYYEHDT
ncbi:MAG: hypothetical protein IJ298_03730 [Ruminococcus sp.]|nr:hypothetical protein [Ruminococcus sp.]